MNSSGVHSVRFRTHLRPGGSSSVGCRPSCHDPGRGAKVAVPEWTRWILDNEHPRPDWTPDFAGAKICVTARSLEVGCDSRSPDPDRLIPTDKEAGG